MNNKTIKRNRNLEIKIEILRSDFKTEEIIECLC
jgi:predicted HAD superfamily Cof-like phosphohydrolase